jgi:hypothetical protein
MIVKNHIIMEESAGRKPRKSSKKNIAAAEAAMFTEPAATP